MAEQEVLSTNEYGLSDEDYAKERKAIRDAMKNGSAMPEEETDKAADAASEQPEIKEERAPQVDEPVVEDPLADLPEDRKEKIASLLKAAQDQSERYKKKYDSDIGRINAYQRKYEDARREKEELEARLAALKNPPKTLKELDSPRIKQALEDGDEPMVDLLEEAVSHVRRETGETIKSLQARLDQQENDRLAQRQREEIDSFNRTLNERYDNWQQVVYQTGDDGRMVIDQDSKMPVFSNGWKEYVETQPPALQHAILNPTSAQDAVWAIDNYADWLKRTGKVKEEPTTVATPNADAIQRKRDNDLKRRTAPAGHQVPLTPTPSNEVTEDNESNWRKRAREAIKKNDPSIYKPN